MLGLKVKVKDILAFLYVVRHYFYCWPFALAWCRLKLSYALVNPYLCSRRYARRQKNTSELLYGETSIHVLDRIMAAAGVSSKDHVFELGAGSGYTSLWMHYFLGCRVTAVELVPVFCWRLGRVARRLKEPRLKVRCENFLTTSLQGATVIYIYGSALEEQTIRCLATKIATLPAGTKIITVSYSLAEFMDSRVFEVTKRLTVDFDWGEADVFIQEVVCPESFAKVLNSQLNEQTFC